MTQGSNRSKLRIIPQVFQALHQFRSEVANELGINPEYKTGCWDVIVSRECSSVGGDMTRAMIAAAEQGLLVASGPKMFRPHPS